MSNAHADTVTLNNLRFAVENGVIQVDSKAAWADPLRITGNQQRGDRVNASQWVMESWSAGLGFKNVKGVPPVNAGDPIHPSFNGFFDSSVETRWEGQVTLPGLIEAISYGTADNTNDDYNFMFAAEEGNGVIPHLVPTNIQPFDIAQVSFSTEVIDQATGVATANFEPRCAVQYDGVWYVLGGDVSTDTVSNYVQMSAAGTWAAFNPSTNNVDHPIVSAVIFNDICYVATVDTSTKIVEIESSSGGLDNFAAIAGMTESAGDTFTAQLVIYADAQGAPSLFLQTDNGLFLCDLANSQLQKVITFQKQFEQGTSPNTVSPADLGLPARPVVWNGNLYIPRGDSLIEYNFTGQWQEISPLKIGQLPEIMTQASGSANAYIGSLFASDGWLYAAFNGGNDGTTNRCSIWAYDGIGWHFIWSKEDASALVRVQDMIIAPGVNSNELAAQVLWVLLWDADSSNNRDIEKIVHIETDPLSMAGVKKYASSGQLITPWFDGGMTEVDTAVLALGAGTGGLDTTANDNEKITAEIALNYSDTYESSGSDIVFYSDSTSIQKYASGAGISTKVWRYRFTLDRGTTNTNTPILYYPIAYYQKVFPDLHTYTFTINVAKTVQINQGQGDMSQTQGVLRAIEAIQDSVVLVPFSYPGTGIHTSATRYVRLVGNPMIQQGSGNPSSANQEVGDATVLVTLEEVI